MLDSNNLVRILKGYHQFMALQIHLKKLGYSREQSKWETVIQIMEEKPNGRDTFSVLNFILNRIDKEINGR